MKPKCQYPITPGVAPKCKRSATYSDRFGMLWCDVHAGRGDVKIAAQQKDAPDEAKRRLTGRNGKPTNVLADSTLESRPAVNPCPLGG